MWLWLLQSFGALPGFPSGSLSDFFAQQPSSSNDQTLAHELLGLPTMSQGFSAKVHNSFLQTLPDFYISPNGALDFALCVCAHGPPHNVPVLFCQGPQTFAPAPLIWLAARFILLLELLLHQWAHLPSQHRMGRSFELELNCMECSMLRWQRGHAELADSSFGK